MNLSMLKQVIVCSTFSMHVFIARRQLRDKSVHPLANLRLGYARKPLDAAAPTL